MIQTPTLVVWTATLLLVAPTSFVALETSAVDVIESVASVVEVKDLTTVGLAIISEISGSDETVGVDIIVKDGASELGSPVTAIVVVSGPVLVESLLANDGPRKLVSRL